MNVNLIYHRIIRNFVLGNRFIFFALAMSQFSLYLKAPDYLAQWLRHDYWDEASARVVFPRGSAPRAILQSLLRKPPKGYVELAAANLLPVEVPSFKGINPASFNYLSEDGRAALVSACKKLFRATLFNELHPLFDHDVQITDIVYDFMDRHGIERTETNWETIRQMYSRQRKKSQGLNG